MATDYNDNALYQNFGPYSAIPEEYYAQFNVKRGLRNSDGTGVVAGVTSISNVHGYLTDEGVKVPTEGRLTLRGYDVNDLVSNVLAEKRFGYEELAFLLWAGDLPRKRDLEGFQLLLDQWRDLPQGFVGNLIMNNPSKSAMNMLARSVLLLYSYDSDADIISRKHEVDVAIQMISRLPRLAVLSYLAKCQTEGKPMYINPPKDGLSTAETVLFMLRPNREWDEKEARVLDVMLMLHAEHGGGNNSTFSTRVLSSSGTDAYSAYAAGISSLKGPKHGGANIKAAHMIDDLLQNLSRCDDDDQIADYLKKVIRKEAFDCSGLVYGMGHALYTLSDPRAVICKKLAKNLSEGTEHEEEFRVIEAVERLTPTVFEAERGSKKAICANIDLYSGFVYRMLGIPEDLFTPLFAVSRMAGWAAHRFEELAIGRRIIRPAYKSIGGLKNYLPMSQRDALPVREIIKNINEQDEFLND